VFTREVIEAMARLNERPIVFALSNPTSKSECTAEQAYAWSGGRALFASGSPFDAVTLEGRHYVPRQGNNCYIFPGVGLGVVAARASRVSDEMFMAAARTLADTVTEQDLAQGSLYPPLSRIREVSARIAASVAEVALAADLADIDPPADLLAFIHSQMYDPHYHSYAA
jgi:malate dehydrogenase (oxaloacetate-decarboxylating)(NADP+)